MFYGDTALFGAVARCRPTFDFFGLDHVLFGTDMPLGGPEVIPDTVADVRAVGLSREDEQKVMQGNAERVLGLAARV